MKTSRMKKTLFALLAVFLFAFPLLSVHALAIGEKDNIFTRWEKLDEKDKDKILNLFEEKCEDELKIIDACVESELISAEMGNKLKNRLIEMKEECIENRQLPPIFFPSLYKKRAHAAQGEFPVPYALPR